MTTLAKRKKSGDRPIVVKRVEEVVGGHHGGAWKVAYADFVTAMMAFFLLMWLLNATTEEQRRGLAEFFNPTHVLAQQRAGLAQPFGGSTPNSAGRMSSDSGAVRVERGPRPVLMDLEEEDDSDRPVEPFPSRQAPPGTAEEGRVGTTENGPERRPDRIGGSANDQGAHSQTNSEERNGQSQAANRAVANSSNARDQALNEATRALRDMVQTDGINQNTTAQDTGNGSTSNRQNQAIDGPQREEQQFQATAQSLRDLFSRDPALQDLMNNLRVEVTNEGLRVQLLESDGTPMFLTGGASPTERTRLAITRIANVIRTVRNPILISGHTDSAPFRSNSGRTNWELSTERANAARRLLQEAGIPDSRIQGVVGLADREPLTPPEASASANRRVSIVILRQGNIQ